MSKIKNSGFVTSKVLKPSNSSNLEKLALKELMWPREYMWLKKVEGRTDHGKPSL